MQYILKRAVRHLNSPLFRRKYLEEILEVESEEEVVEEDLIEETLIEEGAIEKETIENGVNGENVIEEDVAEEEMVEEEVVEEAVIEEVIEEWIEEGLALFEHKRLRYAKILNDSNQNQSRSIASPQNSKQVVLADTQNTTAETPTAGRLTQNNLA